MVIKKFLHLANLTKAQVFYINELREIFIIYGDKNFMFANF